MTAKTQIFECKLRNVPWVKSTPNTWHRCARIEKKIADIRSCSPNMSPALTSLWKHRSVLCTHLCFQVTIPSFLRLFLCPRRSHSQADIDQSPWLYLLCVLWQNRGKWQRRWRRRRGRGLKANKWLLGDGARRDKMGWCRLMQTTIRSREPRQEVLPLWFLLQVCCH